MASHRRYCEKLDLLSHDATCKACGRAVVAAPHRSDSAHLVRHLLSCPDHVDHVRRFAKSGFKAIDELQNAAEKTTRDPYARVYEIWTKIEPGKREHTLKLLVNDMLEHVSAESLDAILTRFEST